LIAIGAAKVYHLLVPSGSKRALGEVGTCGHDGTARELEGQS
jgi:hypothetical protein